MLPRARSCSVSISPCSLKQLFNCIIVDRIARSLACRLAGRLVSVQLIPSIFVRPAGHQRTNHASYLWPPRHDGLSKSEKRISRPEALRRSGDRKWQPSGNLSLHFSLLSTGGWGAIDSTRAIPSTPILGVCAG